MRSNLSKHTSEGEHIISPKEKADNFTAAARERPYGYTGFRVPLTSAYVAASIAVAMALFFFLWWMLQNSGDEAPWIPAGLAASVVLLVSLAAREVVLRRALTRQILEKERRDYRVADFRRKKHNVSLDYYSSALRSLQKHSDAVDKLNTLPQAHLELFQACRDYLAKVDDALRSSQMSAQSAVTLRASQERARALQKHHLLSWAAASSREWTSESQKRLQPEEKAKVARKALDAIDSALKIYPNEQQLLQSANAIREHIASLRVAHWVELAERAAFKEQTERAIEHYQDALFYLSKDTEISEPLRLQIEKRINSEIEKLRAVNLRKEKEIEPSVGAISKDSLTIIEPETQIIDEVSSTIIEPETKVIKEVIPNEIEPDADAINETGSTEIETDELIVDNSEQTEIEQEIVTEAQEDVANASDDADEEEEEDR